MVHTRNYQSLIPESCILSHHSLTVSHRRPGCCEARCLQNTTESWAGMGVKLCTLYSDQDWLSLPPARAAWSLTHVRGQWQPIRRPAGESATNQRLGTPHSLHTRDPNTASNTNTRIIPGLGLTCTHRAKISSSLSKFKRHRFISKLRLDDGLQADVNKRVYFNLRCNWCNHRKSMKTNSVMLDFLKTTKEQQNK